MADMTLVSASLYLIILECFYCAYIFIHYHCRLHKTRQNDQYIVLLLCAQY